MTKPPQEEPGKLAGLSKALEEAANSSGHPFAIAVAHAIQARWDGGGQWLVDQMEVPVQAGGRESRIDLLLRSGCDSWGDSRNDSAPQRFITVECKRANPSLKRWVFLRADRVRRVYGLAKRLVAPVHPIVQYCYFPVNFFPRNPFVIGVEDRSRRTEELVHVGYEIKTPKDRGNASGGGRDAIEQALAQAMLGLAGFTEILREEQGLTFHEATILPAVVTTADLFVYDGDELADLERGNLAVDENHLRQVDWVLYHHPGSRGLGMKNFYQASHQATVSAAIRMGHARTVAIVNARAVTHFLDNLPLDFDSFVPSELRQRIEADREVLKKRT